MKKKLLWISALILAVVTAVCSLTFLVSAQDPAPAMSIDYCNLSFRDSVCVKYAVKIENTETASVLVWETPESEYVYGTQDAILGSSGTQTIKGGTYYVFDYEALAAKQMTDEIYARAYCRTAEGEEYYSPVKKFSVLEYAMTVLADPTTAEPLANLMRAMLDYGAAAQSYTNYQTDRLANQTFYRLTVEGGTLADGMTTGLYPAGASVTLVAPETDAEGKPFRHWENSAGAVVHEEVSYALTTLATDETYTAVYGQTELLLFTELADGTYSVKANSEATLPSAIAIPATYNGKAVTEIETSAFEGLTHLTSVTLPAGIKTVGEKAFSGCTALESLLLPDTVTTIGTRAFHNCATITEFTVPASVTSIGTQIFYGCNALTKVYYNSSYADQNNPFLSVKNLTEIVFGGTTVPGYILYANTYVQTVKIQDTVKSIGYSAFCDCKNFTSITIPNSVTSIDSHAFYNCKGLTSITIPDSVKSIGSDAFSGCTGLTIVTIPDSVTNIGSYAFSICTGLTSMIIGDSVTSIDEFAFSGCTGLTSITIPDSVTSIGGYTFQDCTGLTNVTIGGSVTSIGVNAFSGCTGLKDIYITDVETWLNISFGDTCSHPNYYGSLHVLDAEGKEVTDLVIPDSVTTIQCYAFYSCTGLTSVTIPDSVTSIGSDAFRNCTGLTSITIPDSIMSIGVCNAWEWFWHTHYDGVFSGCINLKDVYITDVEAWLNISFDSIYSHPNYYGSLHILDAEGKEVTDLVIPDSATSIGNYAFFGCTGLTSVTIPDSVTSIGDYAFDGCTGLTSIVYEGTSEQWLTGITFGTDWDTNTGGYTVTYLGDEAAAKGVKYTLNDEGSGYVVTDGSGCTVSDLTILSYYNGLPVVGIVERAFEHCATLTSVTIPYGIKSIGDYAFENCYNLTSVTISDGVTSVGDRAFYNCIDLASVTIPDSVTSIGDYAFENCDNLTSVTISDGVTSIGEGAFDDCESLSSVTLGENVTHIGGGAFYECFALKTITIPTSVKSIGRAVFFGCATSITYLGTCAQWNEIALDESWNLYLSSTEVICSDGNVSLI